MIRIGGKNFAALSFVLVFFLTILDRLLKTSVESPIFANRLIGWRFFGFERFHNMGIAFGIPLPLWLVVPLTFLFLITLAIWVKKIDTSTAKLAFLVIFVGALSNAFDRVTYGFTIDYLRVINAIINIADLFVIIGIGLLVSEQSSTKK